jgi:hypothetical protein
MVAENVDNKKKKKKRIKWETLKKDGKHISKYDAGYFSWHSDQDVGHKTDESRFTA